MNASLVRTISLKRLIVALAGLHFGMLAFALPGGFQAFLRGDRSGARLESMTAATSAGDISSMVAVMVGGEVHPGEYFLQLPFHALAGPPGVIALQICLTLMAVVCIWKTVELTVPAPIARPLAAGLYGLTPMTLTFTHQLTTEAIATPFCVFFIYWAVRAISGRNGWHAVFAGLCLGAVILVRPGFMVIIPALICLGGLLCLLRSLVGFKALAMMCLIACLPIAGWTAVYTANTGEFGYTGGVANVGWNLRSKVFFVERANGRQGPEEVADFVDYGQFWSPQEAAGGISLARYLAIASENPVDYAKAAATDLALTFGRGGFSKLAVDYFGIARDQGIKEWRNVLDSGGPPALIRWAGANLDILAVTAMEIASSLISVAFSLLAFGFMFIALVRHGWASRMVGPAGFALIVICTCLIATTLLSALIVDRAQPRLRHPSDPSILLLAILGARMLLLRVRGEEPETGTVAESREFSTPIGGKAAEPRSNVLQPAQPGPHTMDRPAGA